MAIKKWEYCALYLGFVNFVEYKEIEKQGWLCDLSISYIGSSQHRETLSILSEYVEQKEYLFLWPFNPWERAIGTLGMMGWELVSIQHELTIHNYSNSGAIAFFKRIKVEERDANEPFLKFPQLPERIYPYDDTTPHYRL